jgi:hypothetical protein
MKHSIAEGTWRLRAPKLKPIEQKGPIERSHRWWKAYATYILTSYKLTPELHRRLSAARRYQSNVSHAIQKATLIDITKELLRNNLSRYPLRNKRIKKHTTTKKIVVTGGLFDDE